MAGTKKDAETGGSTPTTAESEAAGVGAPVAEQIVLKKDSIEAAQKQYQEDLDFKTANPHQPLVRGSNPEVGGE